MVYDPVGIAVRKFPLASHVRPLLHTVRLQQEQLAKLGKDIVGPCHYYLVGWCVSLGMSIFDPCYLRLAKSSLPSDSEMQVPKETCKNVDLDLVPQWPSFILSGTFSSEAR